MIGLMLPALLVALGAALLPRGRGGQRPPLRWPALALLALGGQLLLFNPPMDEQPWALAWGPGLYIASLLGVLAVLLRNGLAPGAVRAPWLLAGLGIALNVLVIGANDGLMPQSRDALRSIGGTPRPEHRLTNVAPLTDHTRLPWLADIIPEPDWLPLKNVISVGDLLLSVGTAWALVARSPFYRPRSTET
jgi:hypothetical protein